jgi:hypothetical protein
MAGIDDRTKCRHGEVGRAHEDDAERRHRLLCHRHYLRGNYALSL